MLECIQRAIESSVDYSYTLSVSVICLVLFVIQKQLDRRSHFRNSSLFAWAFGAGVPPVTFVSLFIVDLFVYRGVTPALMGELVVLQFLLY